ncbi:MAG: tetracycline regulation of excision, RteC, partial [Sphingobacteriales bacterium]
LRDIEINRPFAEGRHLKHYYVKCLDELEVTKSYSREFYNYYRSGDHTKDSLFFLRNPLLLKQGKDTSSEGFDAAFMTPHDHTVANILASSRLQECLQGKIKVYNRKASQNTLKWTGTKVELVELIYALHLAGKLNGGNAGLKQVASCMEAALNIELGQLHRIFLEIRERKKERTKFLAMLRENLIRYMEQADA